MQDRYFYIVCKFNFQFLQTDIVVKMKIEDFIETLEH